jgi:hypothetical protein
MRYIVEAFETHGSRLNMETVWISLGSFKATFPNDEEKKLAEPRKEHVETKFYGLKIRMVKELSF